jgi:hypothetical protein
MDHSVFLELGVGFVILKMLFDTVITGQIKLRKTDTELIPIAEWRDLKKQVVELRVEMGQIKTLLRGRINGKTDVR